MVSRSEPRARIVSTSTDEAGQIYVPAANWLLMVATLFTVLFFRTSDNLAAAYFLAIHGENDLLFWVYGELQHVPRTQLRELIHGHAQSCELNCDVEGELFDGHVTPFIGCDQLLRLHFLLVLHVFLIK